MFSCGNQDSHQEPHPRHQLRPSPLFQTGSLWRRQWLLIIRWLGLNLNEAHVDRLGKGQGGVGGQGLVGRVRGEGRKSYLGLVFPPSAGPHCPVLWPEHPRLRPY